MDRWHVMVAAAQKPPGHSLSSVQPRHVFVATSQTRFPQLLLSTHSTHVWSGPHAGNGSAHAVAARHCTQLPGDVSQRSAGPVQSEFAWHDIGATHSFEMHERPSPQSEPTGSPTASQSACEVQQTPGLRFVGK
jgi:hypothetical protein